MMSCINNRCFVRNIVYLIGILLIKILYTNSACFSNDNDEFNQNNLLSIKLSSNLQLGIFWRFLSIGTRFSQVIVSYKLSNEGNFTVLKFKKGDNGLIIPGVYSYLKSDSVYIVLIQINNCKLFPRYVLTGPNALSKTNTTKNDTGCPSGVYDFLLQPMSNTNWSYLGSIWSSNETLNTDALIDDVDGYKSINYYRKIYPYFCVGMSDYSQLFTDGKWAKVVVSSPNTLLNHFSNKTAINFDSYVMLAMSDLPLDSLSKTISWYPGFQPVTKSGYNAPLSYTISTFNISGSKCDKFTFVTCGKGRYSGYCSIPGDPSDAFCEFQPYCYLECALPFPQTTVDQTKTSFKVSWDAFNVTMMQNSSNFIGYSCAYKPSDSLNWLKNTSSNLTSYSINNLTSFTVYNVRCKVESYLMTVFENYMFINITTDESEPTGAPLNFTGIVASPSEFNFTWLEVEYSLRHGIVDQYLLICTNLKTKLSRQFEISDNQLEGQATGLNYESSYNCTVSGCTSGGCGKKTAPINLKTYSPIPTVAPNVTYANFTSSTSIHVKWNDVNWKSWGVLENRMFCVNTKRDSMMQSTSCVDYLTTEVDVTDLQPYTEYEFSVYCKNLKGSGPMNLQSLFASTDQQAPDALLSGFDANVSVNSLNFSWEPPDLSQIYGPITGYTVIAMALISEEDYMPIEEPVARKRRSLPAAIYNGLLQVNETIIINDPNATSVQIENLFGFVNYTISAAINNKYNGSFSEPLVVSTVEGTPVISVLNLRCCGSDHESLTICWDDIPPLYLQGILTNYRVYYKVKNKSSYTSIEQDSSLKSIRLIFLLPITKYVIKITAWTKDGEGVPSEDLVCETLEWYPDKAPTNVAVTNHVYPNAAIVRWAAIPLNHWLGIPSGYQILYKRIKEGSLQINEDWVEVKSSPLSLTFTLLNLNVFSKYLLKVAGYTAAGIGKHSNVVEFETCLVDNPNIEINYFQSPPFVQSAAFLTPSGILVNTLETSLLTCAQKCSSFKQNVTIVYRPLDVSLFDNILNITNSNNNLKGAIIPILNPHKTIPGAKFVSIAASLGFVIMEIPDYLEVIIKQNEEIFLKTVIGTMSFLLLYFIFNILAGVILFVCEPQNAQLRSNFFSLSGMFEGAYLAIVTSTLVGYGDKKPAFTIGRMLFMLWIIFGIVINGILVGKLSSALTTYQLSRVLEHFPNEPVIGVEGSAEYKWASNHMIVENSTKYFSYEQVVQALETGAIKYAIFDQYAIKPYKSRLMKAGTVVAHTYPNNIGSVGVVLLGSLSLLSSCVEQFIQANRDILENDLKEYEKNLTTQVPIFSLNQSPEKLRESDLNTSFFNFSAPLFRKLFTFFFVALGVLFVFGLIYELIRRWQLKVKANKVQTTLDLKLSLQRDLVKLSEEFENEFAAMIERLLKNTDVTLFRHCKELLDLTTSCSKMYGVDFKYIHINDLGVSLEEIASYREELNNLPKVPWYVKFKKDIYRKYLWLKIRAEPVGNFFTDLI
ncbi:uncharacterized protein LOC101241857 isoform X2 [Hydra vulgaris]|uniref:uncharacterized protein LOC101241857 isoform X2 n=1 Tax=Hydra vulgaris TaxID=6087 RepID=UPI001F5FF252|nr:uncharacterized protein LOC101241857 isoform X2 [Hydra vulgaris]